jgi:dolichol-phosphate mannosyltransferase
MCRVLVMLPTYNEAANLQALVEAILHQCADTHDIDVLVIDDNSPDGTGQIADRLHTRYPTRVHILHRPTKEGLGRAYAAGLAWARAAAYEVVAHMDADFSHDPATLPRLVAAIAQGADVVIGSRYVPGGQTPGWPWRRRLLSWAGSHYAAAVLGLPVRDLTGGFKAFSPRALAVLAATAHRAVGFAFQIETTAVAYGHGLVVREVPIIFRERRAGSSKMSRAIVLEALLLPWQLRMSSAHIASGASTHATGGVPPRVAD